VQVWRGNEVPSVLRQAPQLIDALKLADDTVDSSLWKYEVLLLLSCQLPFRLPDLGPLPGGHARQYCRIRKVNLGTPCINCLTSTHRFESISTMKTITIATLLVALATPVLAQQKAEDHSAHHAAAAASAADMTEGEIRKVDRDAKKLTIKHGEIKNLDMPPMTMVFQLKHSDMLDKLKAGDKIRFAVEKTVSGLVVTEIQPAP
jgi:Cu(I)/Ag(I) efflux system periplasmic protein CusF